MVYTTSHSYIMILCNSITLSLISSSPVTYSPDTWQAEGGAPSSILLREAVLEEQLERAHASIVTLKHDKNALKLSIRELQTRLTNAQVHKKNGGDEVKSQTAAGVQEAMMRGEREKGLEKQLIKSKKDKDKALKLLIQLIGKVSELVAAAAATHTHTL